MLRPLQREMKKELVRTALHFAAEAGCLQTCTVLLDNGFNIDARDHYLVTPMHLAAQKGHFQVVEYLAQRGALIEARTAAGWTALHFAAQSGHAEVCRLLVELQSPLDQQTNRQETPLFFAVEHPNFLPIVELMISKGAKVSHSTHKGTTPLHIAAFKDGEEGWFDICSALIAAGADAGATTWMRSTPLHYAANRGRMCTCHLLIENGANPHAVDEEGQTPRDRCDRRKLAEFDALFERYRLAEAIIPERNIGKQDNGGSLLTL